MPVTLACVGISFIALVALGIAEVRRSPEPVAGGRRARGISLAILTLLALSPGPAALVLLLGERDLGVARPERPLASPGSFDFSLDFTGILAVTAVAALVLLTAIVAGAYLLGARRATSERRGVPSGALAWRVARGAGAAVMLAWLARLALGGAPASSFPAYGAITPGYATGWRAELTLARQLGGAVPGPIAEGPPLESDVEYHGGSDCCGALAHPGGYREISGVKGWVEGRPVVFEVVSPERREVVLREVAARDESSIPRARRPEFERRPRVAPIDRGYGDFILLDRREDGAVFAVRISEWGSLSPARIRDAGLLLAPPLWPALLLLVAGLAALALARRASAVVGPRAGPRRLAAAALLLVAAGVSACALWPYV